MTDTQIGFRSVEPEDREFLYLVYAATREDELAQLSWSQIEKEAFLRMQFEAQRAHYERHFANADFLIIVADQNPAGRLYLGRFADEIRIIDIALLPEFRNRGIGASIIGDVITEAREAGKPVRCHVEKFNPALRFYQCLGFVTIGDKDMYWFIEWRPFVVRP